MSTIYRYIFAIATMAAVLSAAAQKHYDSNIALGFKGGVALCRTQFRPTVPQAWLPGMLLGVSFRYIEEKHFGLIAELNFEQRGWKETFEKTSLQYQRRLTYIQLPVLTHIYFGTSRFKFFANLGPEIGFMIGNSISSNFDYTDPYSVKDFPAQYRSIAQFTLPVKKKFDYGITAGLGMEYRTKGRHAFNLEGRFYYGLGNVFGDRKADAFSQSSGMTITATLGYSFRIK